MDAFLDPFWNLDQVVAWARSRSPAAVRFAENAPHLGRVNSDLSIEIKTNAEASRAKSAGRDIEAELWEASKQPRPVEVDDLHSQTCFPIEGYLLGLFRNGILTAHGNLPGDPLARQLSADDWGGLVIGVGGNMSVSVTARPH